MKTVFILMLPLILGAIFIVPAALNTDKFFGGRGVLRFVDKTLGRTAARIISAIAGIMVIALLYMEIAVEYFG